MYKQDQITNEQRNKKFISNNNLISYMNNTKWNKFLDGLITNQVSSPVVKYKYIRHTEIYGPSHVDWEDFKSCQKFENIEWIKVLPIEKLYIGEVAGSKYINRTDEYIKWLSCINVHYVIENAEITIYGYKKSSQ